MEIRICLETIWGDNQGLGVVPVPHRWNRWALRALRTCLSSGPMEGRALVQQLPKGLEARVTRDTRGKHGSGGSLQNLQGGAWESVLNQFPRGL